jgi:transposase
LATRGVSAGGALSRPYEEYLLECAVLALSGPLGVHRTIIAIAPRLFGVIYEMLARADAYRERGAGYYDPQHKQPVVRRLQRRMAGLGYNVTREPQMVAA